MYSPKEKVYIETLRKYDTLYFAFISIKELRDYHSQSLFWIVDSISKGNWTFRDTYLSMAKKAVNMAIDNIYAENYGVQKALSELKPSLDMNIFELLSIHRKINKRLAVYLSDIPLFMALLRIVTDVLIEGSNVTSQELIENVSWINIVYEKDSPGIYKECDASEKAFAESFGCTTLDEDD